LLPTTMVCRHISFRNRGTDIPVCTAPQHSSQCPYFRKSVHILHPFRRVRQYVMLLGSQHHTLCCLAVSTILYVAWQSAPYVMLPGSQHHTLCCLAVRTLLHVAWQSAQYVMLPGSQHQLLFCLHNIQYKLWLFVKHPQ